MIQEPWEAQAFSLLVALYDAGHFTWPEWVATISAEIRQAQAKSDPDLGHTYYRHCLTAPEKTTVAKSLAGEAELRLRRVECAANLDVKHDHPPRREPTRIG